MQKLLASLVLSLLSAASACGDSASISPAPSQVSPKVTPLLPRGYTPASLKPGTKLETYGDCTGEEFSCPGSAACVVVFLDTGTMGPTCVSSDACQTLTCGGSTCSVLDSLPAQVACKN